MNAFEVVTRACGVGVLAALCLALIGKQSGGYGMAIRIGGATLLFGILAALLSGAIETLGELTVLADSSYAQEGYSVMLKGLGVALLSRFCADICKTAFSAISAYIGTARAYESYTEGFHHNLNVFSVVCTFCYFARKGTNRLDKHYGDY